MQTVRLHMLSLMLTVFSAFGAPAVSIAQGLDCCGPGASCCYAGSPCCAGHNH